MGGVITPILLGSLIGLIALTLSISVKAWYDIKHSPYYFLRRQAQQRLQNYALVSCGLILATLFTAAYAFQPPADVTVRTAVINNAKPATTIATLPVANTIDIPEIVDIGSNAGLINSLANSLPQANALSSLASRTDVGEVINIDSQATNNQALSFAPTSPILPEEYNSVSPEIKTIANAQLTPLVFTQYVNDNYAPVTPRRIFNTGQFTLYATFDYEHMRDGMAWSWVWRYKGKVVGGGNEMWQYGNNGPGYVYLNPEDGFQPGQYDVEIWVNNEIMTQGTVYISDGAATAH
ncbi:MAG TPA: hypothetical protein VLL52_01210 [Anaerolineae bacterium]|nr:hypothetical protein [Anaerolineae bacterium]